jgi:hypothetical protein
MVAAAPDGQTSGKVRKHHRKRRKSVRDSLGGGTLQTNIKFSEHDLHTTTFLFGDDLDPNFANLSMTANAKC